MGIKDENVLSVVHSVAGVTFGKTKSFLFRWRFGLVLRWGLGPRL